jgi:type II secretory pathway component PulM
METPLHAAKDVDKDENVPRIVAIIAGVVLIVIAAVALTYTGIWSPPATKAAQTTTAPH